MRTCILLILLLACSADGARAQFGSVIGRVVDARSTEPLADANVTLTSIGEQRGTATDALGRFTFTNITPGTYELAASHVGYVTSTLTIEVAFGQIVSVDTRLDPAPEDLEEVVVEADASAAESVGRFHIDAADLERIPLPDVSGDLASYLLTRPGVVSPGDRGGQLFIRGGTPAHNLVLLDGMRVYQPFHIVGFYSIFPSDLVARADVFAGGFGARYGGRIGSVVDVRSRNGNKQRVTGAISMAPFLASVHAGLPFVPGAVSLVGSARESIIERLSPGLLGRELPYRFGDRFVKLHAYLNTTSSLSLTLLNSFDEGNIAGLAGRDRFSRWINTSAGGRYTYLHPETAIMTEIEAYGTHYSSRFIPSDDEERTSDITSYHGEMHVGYLLDRLDVHFGFFGSTHLMAYNLGTRDADVSENVTEAGVYAYVPWDVVESLHVEPGVRIQTFTNGIGTSVEPRLRGTWSPGGILDRQRFTGALGIYHQQLLGLNNQRDVTDAFFAWVPNPRFSPLPRSSHVILGTSRALLPYLSVSVDLYRRSLRNVSFALLDLGVQQRALRRPAPLERVDGSARGIDLTLELTRSHLYLYAGYSLSAVTYRLERERERVRPDDEGVLHTSVQQTDDTFSAPHDRRHQLNLVAQLAFGSYELSARWQIGSGLPFTPIHGYVDLPVPEPNDRDHLSGAGPQRASFGEAYSKRLPTYHRLDVSAERSFDFEGWGLVVHAGIVNVYDRANIFSYDLLLNRRIDQFPIIPTVGMKIQLDG
ncbi:MAG: TonB-dependent receptor [Rhodothermales bacterium]